LNYLYEENPEILEKLVNQIASKSIAEFLAKCLTFEGTIVVGMSNELLNVRLLVFMNSGSKGEMFEVDYRKTEA
jgi:hypothetical protein